MIDRRSHNLILFQRAERGRASEEKTLSVQQARETGAVEAELLDQALEELELLEGAGADLDLELVHGGELSPVFFGSAMTNFGVRPFLDAFLELAQRPAARPSSAGVIEPIRPGFSGFVFKLQANMDPRHRDRVAFVRVCSGKFEKDMTVQHARTGRAIRL